MGHAHIRNLNDILIKRIFAKGKASVKECVDYCVAHKIPLKASERDYLEDYMLIMGFEEVVFFHARPWDANGNRPTIEPVIEEEEQQKLFDEFKEHGFYGFGDEDHPGKGDKFNEIQWKFTKGSRMMYLKKTLPYTEYFEN